MERLDACYFCGTATDAPLREVSISPRERQGDPDATVRVTLCPSCEEKLQRVLGGLFDHVESRSADGAPSADRTPGRDVDRAADDATPADDGPSAGDVTPAVDTAPAVDASTRAPGPDRVDRIDVSSAGDDEPTGRRRLFTDPNPIRDVGGAPADDGDDGEDAEILDDEPDAGEPRVRARATATTGESLDGVSVTEYNRVMRLLQNREFPMARSAFVDLATSAYDLGEDTVESVLDAVIDQGALAEREGELVRGGDAQP